MRPDPALDAARRLDDADPLRRFRSRFLIPKRRDGRDAVYLCGNSLGLQPQEARAAVARELDDWARLGVAGHFAARAPWFSYHERFRESGARIVGALPGEVVMMNGLTVNLHLMLASFFRPEGARRRILMAEPSFPSDRYAAASALRLRGLDPARDLLWVSPRPGETCVREEDLLAALAREGPRLALVLLEGVNYLTGQAFDIRRLTEAAHAAGARCGFDLAHAAGNVPLSLHDWGVDFAAWCSYKYLNAGPGAVAGCFVHARHGGDASGERQRDASLPRLAGWWGNEPARRFRMDEEREFAPRAGADGWQLSNPPILALAPLEASLALFDEAGRPALREKSIRLTGFLEQLLDEAARGRYEIITPRAPAARGCQLSLKLRAGGQDLAAALEERGIVADFRPPDILRVAPVPLYNRFADAEELARALDELLG